MEKLTFCRNGHAYDDVGYFIKTSAAGRSFRQCTRCHTLWKQRQRAKHQALICEQTSARAQVH
jgi:hypothetical protein